MDEKASTNLCGSPSHAADLAPAAAASALPMYLIMVSGGIPGAMLRLSADGTRIGRAPDNTFALNEVTISRHHAFFDVNPHGVVRLTDAGSSNGTFLNGRRLVPHAPARIQDGDRIQLGSSVVLKFVRLDPCDEQFQREMFERTVRDALTGLYNRAYFLNQVASLASFGALHGLGLGILMLDIDHFKEVNDTHGHDVGDLVIREVAKVLRESTRSEDLVARYGGEEFTVALPVAAPDLAAERAERIRDTLAERTIAAREHEFRITASIGLAYAQPGTFRSANALITIADHSLYQAKKGGRNRVVFCHEAPLHREPSRVGGD